MYRFIIALGVVFGIPAAASAAQRPVRGVLRFEERTQDGGAFVAFRPVRFVTVTIKRGSTTIGTAMTGQDGYFSRWIDTSQLPVGGQVTIELKAQNYAARVYLDTDTGLAPYVSIPWQYTRTIVAGTDAIEIGHDIAQDEGSVHLSILDSITYGREYADQRRDDDDDITQVDVQYPETGDTTFYSDDGDVITIQGPKLLGYPYGGSTVNNGWRDLVVLHEYGHHLEYYISNKTSGSHRACSDSGHTYAVAWTEGFASYFGWAVGDANPTTIQGVPGEETVEQGCPPASENVTRAALWDLLDPANEAHDVVDGARVLNSGTILKDVVFQIFDHEQDNDIPGLPPFPTDIRSFHDAWVARNMYAGAHADLDKLFFFYGIDLSHGKTDLVPVSLSTTTSSVPAGSPVVVTSRATRSGYVYADEPLRARYFLYTFGGNIDLATIARAPFPTTAFNTTLTIPQTVPAGTYALMMQVDPANRITESDETNNIVTTFITITPYIPSHPF